MRALALAAVLVASSAAAQHAGDLLMGSTQAGDGALGLVVDPARRVVVSPSVLPGFFTTTDPGFDALVVFDAGSGLHPLAVGTQVTVELVAAGTGVSIKIGAAILDTPGDVAPLPALHTHPEWRLVHEGDGFAFADVTVRLLSTAYAPSPGYTLTVTNDPTPPSTTTTMPGAPSSTTSTTTTTLPPACAPTSDPHVDAACSVERLVTALADLDRTTQRTLRRRTAAVRRLLARAASGRSRRLARVVRLLDADRSIIARAVRRGRIDADAAALLTEHVDAVAAAVARLRA